MKHLEKMANIAVILAVVVFLVLVYRGEFGKRKTQEGPSQNLVGKSVSLPGVHLPRDRDSLVLVVSTTCHFFQGKHALLQAAMEEVAWSAEYCGRSPSAAAAGAEIHARRRCEANQVISSILDAIGVRGTPTVLLVDGSGKVKHVWVGRLDEKGQEDLLAVALPRHKANGNPCL